jgi:hypothetical protein
MKLMKLMIDRHLLVSNPLGLHTGDRTDRHTNPATRPTHATERWQEAECECGRATHLYCIAERRFVSPYCNICETQALSLHIYIRLENGRLLI